PAAEDDRRGAHGTCGGGRWERLGIDPERLLERGGRVLLDDEPPLRDERVAHTAFERGGVHLDFVATAALRRIFVALAAAGRVEEWAEPLPRTEDAVEDHLALREARDRKSTRLNSSHVSISYAVF